MRSLNSSAHQSLSVGAARRSPLAARHSTSVPTTLEQGGAAALGRSVCFLSSGDRAEEEDAYHTPTAPQQLAHPYLFFTTYKRSRLRQRLVNAEVP